MLRVIGAKLGPDLSPFLVSNWFFLCGCLEIFFGSLGLGNLSTYHLSECVAALSVCRLASSFIAGELFPLLFLQLLLCLCRPFSHSGTPVIGVSTSMTMSISLIFAPYFEIFLP